MVEKDILADTVLLMGKGLIESGSELKRAEDTMNRLIQNSPFLSSAEKKKTYVYVTINSIFLRQGQRNVDFVTILSHDFNLNKVVQLNQLSRDYSATKISIQQLYQRAESVLNHEEPKPFNWLAYSLLSASVTLILNGSPLECVLAALIGLVTSQSYPFLLQHLSNRFIPEFLAAFLSGLIACLFSRLFGLDSTLLYTAAIIPLVPGIRLTNGVHDTFDDYFISGPVMILESFTTLISISLGITLVQLLPFGVEASGQIDVVSVPVIAQLIGSAICSISFAYIIFAPKNFLSQIGIAGAITWWVYTITTREWNNNLLNTLISICILSLISQLLARRFKAPMTIFFIPSLVALVPGITMFVGFIELGTGQIQSAIVTLTNVVVSLLGLTIGSIAGAEIYKALWFFRVHQ